jgi:SAM-dependent methyltransferase
MVDASCLAAALDYMRARFPPEIFGRLLEPGVGTGRIALPLAERGYAVAGVDLSAEMLEVLRHKLGTNPAPRVSFCRADVTALPFADGAFDLEVAVHLFYFIPNWRRAADELLRVTRVQGAVILMHTGTGAEIPLLNARYRELCAEAGWPIRDRGVHSTREVVEYLCARGCQAEWLRDRWRWSARLRLDQALEHLRARAYSFTTTAPEAIHQAAVTRLSAEMRALWRPGCRSGCAEPGLSGDHPPFLIFPQPRAFSLRRIHSARISCIPGVLPGP